MAAVCFRDSVLPYSFSLKMVGVGYNYKNVSSMHLSTSTLVIIQNNMMKTSVDTGRQETAISM